MSKQKREEKDKLVIINSFNRKKIDKNNHII